MTCVRRGARPWRRRAPPPCHPSTPPPHPPHPPPHCSDRLGAGFSACNDTPEALATYAARFDADPKRWKFLTGDLKLIEQVGQKVFRLPVELGVHSERGVVFDRQGRLRGGYHLLQQDRVDLLTKLIREVLAEKSSAADAGIVP